jgi:hypothetical protein
MQVSANITRRDLLLVGLILLPKSRANWIVMVLATAGVFGYFVHKFNTSVGMLVVEFILALMVGIASVLGAFLGNAVCFLLAADKNSGVFGVHEFSLTPEGLNEKTSVNDSHYAWHGIKAVFRVRGYLLIQVHGAAIYFIPHAAFSSPAQCEEFYALALSRWELAHQAGHQACHDRA